MFFKQYYLGCLAQASYLLGSDGMAAVVDPQRDVDQYLTDANAQGLTIKYIIETHLHADFVSGHQELTARTGATLVYSALAGVTVPHQAVTEGSEIHLGSVTLRVLETPGHTPESICLLATDAAMPDAPAKLLTGDTLFIGAVGRPDLVGAKGFTAEQMAAALYDSLHEKVLRLPDETEVFPAHGAGSLCGKGISKETSSTIGAQRRTNYALQQMSQQEFIAIMTDGLPETPAYFAANVEMNRHGAASLSDLPHAVALTPAQVQTAQDDGAIILDVRDAATYGAGHVPDSVNIGLGGQFASWVGTLLPMTAKLIIVAENEAQVTEAVTRAARVGFENIVGYLAGGVTAWADERREVQRLEQISVTELQDKIATQPDLQVIDVRRIGEYEAGHVPAASSAPLAPTLGELRERLDPTRPTAVICQGGYRSSAAASILASNGFRQLYNVTGGTGAWLKAGYAAASRTNH